jgi:hypothetical protein
MSSSLMPNVVSATCLNEDTQNNLAGVLRAAKSRARAILASDCDEQLLFHFEFGANEAANVHAIVLAAPSQGVAVPKSVQVYVNARSLTFASLDGFKPLDTVPLQWRPSASDPMVQIARAQLKSTPYHNAFQVSVLIPDNTSNGDDDVTVISGIDLLGEMAKGLGTTAAPQKG